MILIYLLLYFYYKGQRSKSYVQQNIEKNLKLFNRIRPSIAVQVLGTVFLFFIILFRRRPNSNFTENLLSLSGMNNIIYTYNLIYNIIICAKTTGLWLIAVRQWSTGYGRVGFPFRVAEKPVSSRAYRVLICRYEEKKLYTYNL